MVIIHNIQFEIDKRFEVYIVRYIIVLSKKYLKWLELVQMQGEKKLKCTMVEV